MLKAYHIFFEGRVQGVGFRYTARSIAKQIGLLGYVKNLPNGNVEMYIEGEKGKIHECIEEIKREMRGYIKDVSLQWQQYQGHFTTFDIRF